ncbi:MAG: aldo/keto reductase [Dehalococcoidia bacterium]|nr:aldo/keto reductase [Dehalococcoidia bacterium]
MEFRKLGNSGLKVSAVGLGGNNFGWWADEQTSITVIDHALEKGINFIDTADIYDRGRSEDFVGKAVKGKRQNVLIATKFGNPMGESPNDRGGSRYHILRAVEASLRRLQTDYIDLYQIHLPDTTTPIEETLRALDDLVRSGKVRYLGCSNFAGWQLCEALWTSKANNLHTFVSVQPPYNLLQRQIERELVPCCQAYNIGIIPYSPLASGFLTGKYQQGKDLPADARLSAPNPRFKAIFTDANWDKLAKLEAFAAEKGHTVVELAIAWLLAKPCISTVIAGARKTTQVDANIAAGNWKLTAEEAAKLDALTA